MYSPGRIGIVGGGQLGRMLAFEAKKMGFHVTVIDPTPQSPAGQVVDEQLVAGYSDADATRKLAQIVDFITVEIEHINTDTLAELEKKGIKVNPSPQTIAMIKDKYLQKAFLTESRIPTAKFIEVQSFEDIKSAGKKFGYPLVLKAKKDAFDGRGNALIRSQKAIAAAMKKLEGRELYAEKFVPFEKELAIVIARSMAGDTALYPIVETIHKNNICHLVKAPADIDIRVKKQAERVAKNVLNNLKGAGVFAIEMFLTKDGKVLVNEIAPRVHNSGHFTIEACVTNQFEQHIRAITGLPLGSTKMLTPAAVMVNILGERKGDVMVQGLEKVMSISGATLHIYGKAETKPDRKMGHITVLSDSVDKALLKAKKARRLLTI